MEVGRFIIDDPKRQETKPFIRLSNIGCGIAHCECSPDRFISISDSREGIHVALTEEEWWKLGLPLHKVVFSEVVGDD